MFDVNRLPAEIFKAYDIRGIVGQTLTTQLVTLIGQSIGSEIVAQGGKEVVIGYDGRLSSPDLAAALVRGLSMTGLNVHDIGAVMTPMLYFAVHALKVGSGIMITGSHNPPEYNGLKMVIQGQTLAGEAIQKLKQRILTGDLVSIDGSGHYHHHDIEQEYIDYITDTVHLKRPLNVIVDAGNGITGRFAPKLYRALGCTVQELFCEVDGFFPNHHPDPSQPKNLRALISALWESDADIGLAFDGDGDRLGVVTRDGNIIYPDRQLMLFARDILSRNPNADIIFDVKSSGYLPKEIQKLGGNPIMSRTGHSFIKAKMKETGALLAGEMSGHLFFKERWFGFDDGPYAGARLLEILSQYDSTQAITDCLNQLPQGVSTPELNVTMAEGEHHALVAHLQAHASFPTAKEIIQIDGLRVEYDSGFGLIRASNTTPTLILRFEAHNQNQLSQIQTEFRHVLQQLAPAVKLPF